MEKPVSKPIKQKQLPIPNRHQRRKYKKLTGKEIPTLLKPKVGQWIHRK